MKNPKMPVLGKEMKQYVRVGDTVEMYCYEQHIKERLANAVMKDGVNKADITQINNINQFGATMNELQKIGKEICRQYLFPSTMGTLYFGSYKKGSRDSEWALSYRIRQTNGLVTELLRSGKEINARSIYECFMPVHTFVGDISGGEFYLKGNGFMDKQQQFEYIKHLLGEAVQYLELDVPQYVPFDRYLDEIERQTANIALPQHITSLIRQCADFYPVYSYVGVCKLLGYFDNDIDKEAVALEVCTTEAKCYMQCIYHKLLPMLLACADSLHQELSSYYIYYVAKLDYRCKRFIREEKYIASKELVTNMSAGIICVSVEWNSVHNHNDRIGILKELAEHQIKQRYGATTKKWLARFKYIPKSA